MYIIFSGVRQEQDMYVRLIDSVTKQVNVSVIQCASEFSTTFHFSMVEKKKNLKVQLLPTWSSFLQWINSGIQYTNPHSETVQIAGLLGKASYFYLKLDQIIDNQIWGFREEPRHVKGPTHARNHVQVSGARMRVLWCRVGHAHELMCTGESVPCAGIGPHMRVDRVRLYSCRDLTKNN